MKNILAIFKEDLKKLFGNVVNGIVTLGLILLPSIFAFYNIIACWDVFDNTGNVKVAVANTDEGYQSDLIPLRMNLGEQVISALRSNDQIKWEFVSEEEAIDGAKAGRYYAAVVIPSTFSKDMLTFYSDGGEQARITYYSNQKKNVIAPKVTDQGASSVSYAVNEAFAQSVSEISLSLVHVMANYLDENGADARIVALADHLEATSRVLDNAASAVEVFGAFGNASKDALDSATKLINATQAGFGSIAGSTVGVAEGVSETAEALDSATTTFKEALTASTESYEQLAQAAKDAAGALGNTSSAMASSMRMQAEAVSAQIASYQELSGLLRQIAPNVPSDVQPVLLAMADRLDSTVKTLEQVRDLLNQSADDLDRANAQAKADIVELEKVSAEAKTSSIIYRRPMTRRSVLLSKSSNAPPKLLQKPSRKGQRCSPNKIPSRSKEVSRWRAPSTMHSGNLLNRQMSFVVPPISFRVPQRSCVKQRWREIRKRFMIYYRRMWKVWRMRLRLR